MKIKKELLIGILIFVVTVLGIMIYGINNQTNLSNGTLTGQENLSLHLSPSDFNNAIKSGKYQLIDVRTVAEFDQGHIQGASVADYYQTKEFNTFLDSLDKNGKYLIYCHTGNRSGKTLQIMQEKGFKHVSDLQGGINAWISYGNPVIK